MDAILRGSIVWFLVCTPVVGAGYRTENFIVNAPDAALAREVAEHAERFRRELALEWLERELPAWRRPCPILVRILPGAGGRTSFSFDGRRPFAWDMEIQGSRERILDSVLPHEVTHTIFATHFGRPLPRWADEGACTTVEHVSERRKQEIWLIRFLKTERGIPFNHMFAMDHYPRDILPLYSQGYSLARYLIAHGGKPKFVRFVGHGMDTGDWPAAVTKYYGHESMGNLQLAWLEWVKQGSQAEAISQVASVPEAQAAAGDIQLAAVNLQGDRPKIDSALQSASGVESEPKDSGRSWYARLKVAEE